MEKLIASRPITAKCIKPKGAEIRISVGGRVCRRADGRYEAISTSVESLSPPTVSFKTFVFDLNPYIAESDLQPST
jgi:hypothetical protein